MTRYRFYAPPDAFTDQGVVLDRTESHHLKDVLRLRPGMEVDVFDGEGNEYLCRLDGFTQHRALLTVREKTQAAIEPPLSLTLGQAIPKGEKFDLIIQKTTELGVHRIVPLLTGYTASSGRKRPGSDRLERWRRIALEATKQSGRARLTLVDHPLGLDRFLSEMPHPAWVFVEPLSQAGSGCRPPWPESSPPSCLLIGPEGGWQPEEVAAAQDVGCRLVSLGPRILRSETAAIAAVALIQHLWGDLR